jgi:hypothetical protein
MHGFHCSPLPRPPLSLYKKILYLPYEEKEDYRLCLAEQGCKTTEVTKPLNKYGHVCVSVGGRGGEIGVTICCIYNIYLCALYMLYMWGLAGAKRSERQEGRPWSASCSAEKEAESIEWFIEDQAFSQSYDLVPQQLICHSFSVLLSVAGRAYWRKRERGGGEGAKIIRRRESLFLCKSFNTLWRWRSELVRFSFSVQNGRMQQRTCRTVWPGRDASAASYWQNPAAEILHFYSNLPPSFTVFDYTYLLRFYTSRCG